MILKVQNGPSVIIVYKELLTFYLLISSKASHGSLKHKSFIKIIYAIISEIALTLQYYFDNVVKLLH